MAFGVISTFLQVLANERIVSPGTHCKGTHIRAKCKTEHVSLSCRSLQNSPSPKLKLHMIENLHVPAKLAIISMCIML